ncbi:hypothetical protein EMCRGX_G032314 [Ephydatia muelleri]
MAAKTNRDKDLEALRHKVSDLEASMVRVNDRLDEMDDKLKERSAMDSEHEAFQRLQKTVVPLKILQVVFEEYVEQLDRSLKETPWSGMDDDLKTRILQSVESHLQLYKLPMPYKGDLKKRIKAYYASRRNTTIMNMNDEKRRQRRMSLKRNCLAYVARDKAVQEAIQKGELNAGDAEAIKAFRDTVRIDAGAVSPVVSSDDEEAAAQNKKKRLENLARARASRQQQRSDIFLACLYFWTERLLRGLTLGFNVSRVEPNL